MWRTPPGPPRAWPRLGFQLVLIDAVHQGHAVGHRQDGLDAVSAALPPGANLDQRDENGWMPLMDAALECRSRIARLLLQPGAGAAGGRAER